MTKNIISNVFFLIFIVVFCFSVLQYKLNKQGNRRIFYFATLDSSDIHSEVRYEPKNLEETGLDGIKFFAEELLLGPATNRYRPLFSLGTKLLFCNLAGDTLYVNLSEDALLEKGSAQSIKDGTEFFKMNILKNFANINTIVMFIGGKQIIYDETLVDA